MNALRTSLTNTRTVGFLTVSYAVLLSYLLLTPEPLVVLEWLFGFGGDEVHDVVDATISTYLQHTAAYCILTALLSWWTLAHGSWSPAICVIIAGGHAFATEILQRFIPQRFGEIYDVLADFAGIGIAISLVASWMILARSAHRVLLPIDSAGSDA